MKKGNKIKIFLQLMKHTLVAKALVTYIIIFLIAAAVMTVSEPTITRYPDGLWYAFVSSSTIGFGDFAAQTIIGRVTTVILYICTILILAVITAFFTQLFTESVKAHRDQSVALFQQDLEHLEDLPPERLAEMSEKIRKLRDN